MTDPEDNTNTRPISVAELLARNGSIGAPPVGGRRRRRRGNSDSVTVAELTGEIPIITDSGESSRRAAAQPPVRQRVDQAPAPAAEAPEPEVDTEAEALLESPIAMELDEEEVFASPDPRTSSDTAASPDTRTSPDTTAPEDDAAPEDATVLDGTPASEGSIAEATAPAVTAEEADYAAHLQQRDVDPLPLDFTSRPRRGQVDSAGFGAEQMSPDPVLDDDELVDLGPDVDFSDVLDKHAAAEESATLSSQVPSYLRSGSDTLFGGQSVADDLARRGLQPGPEDIDLGDDAARSDTEKKAEPTTQDGSALVRGVWIVAQCILAVAFGAGLFIAFDQLWRWNTIVALVLSVLVILGLVVGVRVVRKTEDIGSTLIAVAVGALVTLGPLALLQSH